MGNASSSRKQHGQNSKLKTRKAYSVWFRRKEVEVNQFRAPKSKFIPTWDNTVPFIPPVDGGLVIKVYDGDTITVATQVYDDPTMYRFSVRLLGINAPEMRTRNPEEKASAEIAQQVLSDLVMGQHVTLQNVTVEKYGRLLADVFLGERNINQYMLENNLVERYEC